MSSPMDYQVNMGLPGGDSFYDVTQMFADAAAGKTPHDPSMSSHSPWGLKICLPGDSS